MKGIIILLSLFSSIFTNPIFNKKFVDNLKKIAPFKVYDVEKNPFRDWTLEEIRAMLSGQIYEERVETIERLKDNESYDFREEHPECMLGIRDQQHCGSCWAFSGTMALQERFCLKSEGQIKVVLSPQDSVSCDKDNLGCNGGWIFKTWNYFNNTGVVIDDCFPYTAGQGEVEECITECKDKGEFKKYKTKSFNSYGGVNAIKKELVANGPIQTGFNVYSDFMSYQGGIYVHTSGRLEGGHLVVIIGYGTEDNVDYWICQNSWGPDWGEEGYFRIKFGQVAIDSVGYAGEPLIE